MQSECTVKNRLDEYVQYLHYVRRYSAHTVRAYSDDVLSFGRFLEVKRLTLSDVQPRIAREWLAQLAADGITARSINRKIFSLKSFFKHLCRNGYLSHSPVSSLSQMRFKKRLPAYVPEKDMQCMFTEYRFKKGFRGHTDRLIIHLLYQTGMRVNELCCILEEDLDIPRKLIRLNGKGGKERLIPIGCSMARMLKRYISLKRRLKYPTPYLFCNLKGQAYSNRKVYFRVSKILSGYSQNVNPHIMRHTFATHMMNAGAPLAAIKELMGHTSLNATQVYLHNTINRLKDVHSLYHPKNKNNEK